MRSQKARLPPVGAGIARTSTLGSAAIIEAKTLNPEVAEMPGDVGHLDRVAEIRLVAPVFLQRLGIGDARKDLGHRLALAELDEQVAEHRLDRLEHVLLLDEAHLDVELVELAGGAVGAGVLVAEAGRDLEVAVEARDHDELLELLRRLRQRVELARMEPRRDEEVARAFGRRRGQDRRLELEEARARHPAADRRDDLRTAHDVPVELLAAKIEEAVGEPGLLGIFLVAEHRHRQFARRRQHLDLLHEHLDRAGRQVRIHRFRRPRLDLAVDPDHPLGAHLLRRIEGGGIRIGHHLGQAVVVAEVDEQQSAVVADAVHPAGEADGLADVLGAERAAGLRAVTVHRDSSRLLAEIGPFGRAEKRMARRPCQEGAATKGPHRFLPANGPNLNDEPGSAMRHTDRRVNADAGRVLQTQDAAHGCDPVMARRRPTRYRLPGVATRTIEGKHDRQNLG